MNKITRILAIVMAIAMAFSLTACGGNTDAPEVTDAPTEAPTTEPVNVCETNGHAWVDATCDVAKTCSVCGETVGEALGHSWIDATYDAPKTCETCGATEGEALVTYFAEHGLMEKLCDKTAEHEMPFASYDHEDVITVTKVTVEDYQTIVSDDTHEAMDGYQWKIMTFKIRFYDENAQKYGINVPYYLWTDIYDVAYNDETDEGDPHKGIPMTVTWNGIDYTDCILHLAESMDGWEKDENGNNIVDIDIVVSIRVPVDYDRFVWGIETAGWEWPEGTYLHDVITDNALLFRFD